MLLGPPAKCQLSGALYSASEGNQPTGAEVAQAKEGNLVTLNTNIAHWGMHCSPYLLDTSFTNVGVSSSRFDRGGVWHFSP